MSRDVGEMEPKWSVSVKGRLTSTKKMNFRKCYKWGGGRGVICNPKIDVADFGPSVLVPSPIPTKELKLQRTAFGHITQS